MRTFLVAILLCPLATAQDLSQAQKYANESGELEARGNYEGAAKSFERAIEEFKKAAGADHPNVAQYELKLANLYLTGGDYPRAEPLFVGVAEKAEKQFGPDSEMVVASLSALGTLYTSMGSFDRAQPYYERALKIARAQNPSSINVANLVGALGSLETFRTNWEKAVPLLEESRALWEKILGPENPNLANPISALAAGYDARGRSAEAEALYLRALALREKNPGPTHPITALSRNNLASFYVTNGHCDKAEPLARRAVADTLAAFGIGHLQSANVMTTLAIALACRGDSKNEALPLLWKVLDANEQLVRNARLTATDQRMGQFLQMFVGNLATIYSLAARDPAAARLGLATALLRKGREVDESADLIKVSRASLGAEDQTKLEKLARLRADLAARAMSGSRDPTTEIERQAEAIEQELALHSLPLRAQSHRPSARQIVEAVTAALPPDSSLVEIILHTPFDFSTTHLQRNPPQRYGAFVLSKNQKDIRFVDLGLAAPIDNAVADLQRAYSHPDDKIDLTAARRLYSLIISPLALTDANLILSPDGQLNLVPFAALNDGEKYLIDRYTLMLVGSGRDLIRDRDPKSGLVVVADPQFSPKKRSPLLPKTIPPLPGTRKEAEALRKLNPSAQLFTGAAATDSALQQTRAPGILHVATHGVFLSDLLPAADNTRGLKIAADTGPKNPLLRSGLILADGMATALEIAGMDLWGTQLVVLSACDTGRGEIKSGQGVFGLRRALGVAGAETVVSSLWRVDDDATRELMTRFYSSLLAGKSRAQSMREASLGVRAKRPHPYFWAPFVMFGQSGPLDGKFR